MTADTPRSRKPLLLAALGLLVVIAAALFTPWFFGVERRTQRVSAVEAPYPLTFPDDFAFGVATAAQQIEHQQPSDWTAFENRALAEGLTGTGDKPGQAKPGHIHHLDRYPAEIRRKKVDFDRRFPDDFAELAALSISHYRFSISWSRLFPRPGMTAPDPAGVDFYRQVVGALKIHGLTPHVTLFHFSSPAWFWDEVDGQRGWERPDAMQRWSQFVDAAIEAIGPEVADWCTLNEPMVFVYNGYLEGLFPPLEQRAGPPAVAPVVHRLLEAHAIAYHKLHAAAKARGDTVRVGLTQHTRAFDPWRTWAPLDRVAAGFVQQAFIWDMLDAIESGTYAMTDTDYRADIEGLKGTQDYVGINYYGRFYVQMDLGDMAAGPIIHSHDPSDPDELESDLDWAIHPIGLSDVLLEAHRRYGKPIQILENGLADARDGDERRQLFLVSHLREVWHAMNAHGVDIDGYFHWSHMDNFEWAEGFGPRFGLFAVDYTNDFARTPRPSALLYQRIIEGGITEEMWQAYADKL